LVVTAATRRTAAPSPPTPATAGGQRAQQRHRAPTDKKQGAGPSVHVEILGSGQPAWALLTRRCPD
jgi:hypothetical protein